MMMTRFVLTLLVGLVVSLGALVSVGPVLAGNWNTTENLNVDEISKFPGGVKFKELEKYQFRLARAP